MTPERQLAFPFPPGGGFSAAEFLPAPSNAEALAWLPRRGQWPGGRLALFGPQGSGKTHLLHAFAEAEGGGMLLAGSALRGLVDVPRTVGLAVDDADGAAEAEALLHLLNRAAELRVPVLLAARHAPSRWPVSLPDLRSRLRATTAVELGLPDDALLRALFARLLAQRQLRVEAGVQDYLLARLPRHGGALRDAAARLDRLSLQAGRAITRAVAAEALAQLGAAEGDDDGAASRDGPAMV